MMFNPAHTGDFMLWWSLAHRCYLDVQRLIAQIEDERARGIEPSAETLELLKEANADYWHYVGINLDIQKLRAN